MKDQIIKYLFIGALGYAVYFIMSSHIIYFSGGDFAILKKEKLTFNNTFNNYKNRKEIQYIGLDNILKNEDLRAAGVGAVLVEKGLITEEELEAAEERVDSGDY
ncbi:MAG: hypothetical protein V2I97_16615 [Desulfococcaceae bacterium]|jgi:hypothetical protein|nr:hypothetical protein [Desulfococcaceae bacterium]